MNNVQICYAYPIFVSRRGLAITLVTCLIGCASANTSLVANATIAKPNVVMAADPQPPFTYWAPENSTIRNHPHQPGIWIAESKDGSRKFYFGDQCHASKFQRERMNVLYDQNIKAIDDG